MSEIERLLSYVVLQKVNCSEWASPMFYSHKERSNPQIESRFERSEIKDLAQAISNPKDPGITIQTQRVSTCNFFGLEHEMLPHQTYS
jgi:hypothetical protein